MELWSQSDVRLERGELRGRCFLLGNKRAFSLCLPAASGSADASLHPHKWFGAYLYGRKFLEAQPVWVDGRPDTLLSRRVQTAFTMSLTTARREYEVDGRTCSEEFFVPDGVHGLACTIDGDLDFSVEPEFDLRFYRTLNRSTDGYEVEALPNGALVSAIFPPGRYDDRTETFLADENEQEETRLYAAVEVVGDDAWVESVATRRRSRAKVFFKDRRRGRLLTESAEYADHAPLWYESTSRVFTPVRLHLRGRGTMVYGFGATRDEALTQLAQLRDNLTAFQAQKTDAARTIVEHAPLETGVEGVDKAYTQVLTRLMDGLVARHATAEDTALERPSTMILAGNQYFHDSWKRDENIALGFLLTLGFYDLAREVIRDTWQLQDEATGRLPQRIRAGEEPPYHSSDGTLWALMRLHQYWRCSGDESLIYEKLPMVERFFRRSLDRAIDGMLPSGRTTDAEYLWETWMDTPHTPRDGFPVEIQMLWLATLRLYRPIFLAIDPELERQMERAEASAWQALQRFNVRGVPADSLDERGQARDLITPNPFFCFSLGLDLGPEVERAMRDVGRHQLAGRQGIVTLSPEDWGRVFSPDFLSDRRHVRGRRMRSVGKYNYHRGVEWNWLSRFFVEGELKYGEPDIAYRTYLRNQVRAVLERGGVGGISELYDLAGTRGPEFQAWSMSGFLEAMHAFAGIRIDVPDRRIVVEPQLPSSWPHLEVRRWYGGTPVDVRYERSDMSLSLSVSFPWGEPPDAEIEAALALTSRDSLRSVDVRLDHIPQIPAYVMEPIAGTEQTRIRIRFPARATAEISVGLRRRWSRVRRSA